jgi:hypothetical protein
MFSADGRQSSCQSRLGNSARYAGLGVEAATHPPRVRVPLANPADELQNKKGNDGETTSNDNATSPREGGTSEVHRPQFSQRAAASARPQAGPGRSAPAPTGRDN